MQAAVAASRTSGAGSRRNAPRLPRACWSAAPPRAVTASARTAGSWGLWAADQPGGPEQGEGGPDGQGDGLGAGGEETQPGGRGDEDQRAGGPGGGGPAVTGGVAHGSPVGVRRHRWAACAGRSGGRRSPVKPRREIGWGQMCRPRLRRGRNVEAPEQPDRPAVTGRPTSAIRRK